MKIIAKNKKAFHDYEILDTIEAGISLLGTEVKSIKNGQVNLRDAYVKIKNEEALLINCHISHYKQGNRENHDETRTRKLLLHKKEIKRLEAKINEQGLSLIPLKIYLKRNYIKLEIALAKGKKLYDKRETLKRKEQNKEAQRILKQRF
jgi:SsrA-binding protein